MTLAKNHHPLAENATRGVGRAYKRFEKDVSHILPCCFLFNPFESVRFRNHRHVYHHGNHHITFAKGSMQAEFSYVILSAFSRLKKYLSLFY
jgi:hypothetical protein